MKKIICLCCSKCYKFIFRNVLHFLYEWQL